MNTTHTDKHIDIYHNHNTFKGIIFTCRIDRVSRVVVVRMRVLLYIFMLHKGRCVYVCMCVHCCLQTPFNECRNVKSLKLEAG